MQRWVEMDLTFDKDSKTSSIINTVLLCFPVAKDQFKKQ